MAHELIQSSYNHIFIVIVLYTIHLIEYLSNDNFGILQDSRFSEDLLITEGSDGRFCQRRHVRRSEYCEHGGKNNMKTKLRHGTYLHREFRIPCLLALFLAKNGLFRLPVCPQVVPSLSLCTTGYTASVA